MDGEDAEQAADEAAGDVADEAREVGADVGHEGSQKETAGEGGRGVRQAAAEEDAEGGDAEGDAKDDFPGGMAGGGADGLQTGGKLGDQHWSAGGTPALHFAAQLVHLHHTAELCALDGDELGAGVVLAGDDDAVAEHEETLVLDAVGCGDAFHGLLHAADFRPVLEEDVAGLGGQLQGLFLVSGHSSMGL